MKPGLLQRRIGRALHEHYHGHRPIGLLLVVGGLQNLATLHGLLWLRALGRLHVSVVRFENLMTLVISGLQNRTPNSSGLVDDGLGRWIALLRR